MLDYSINIPGQDVFIAFYDEYKEEALCNEVLILCNKYDINIHIFNSLSEITSFESETVYKIVHIIARVKSCFDAQILRNLNSKRIGEYNSSSIAFSYKDQGHSIQFIEEINSLKSEIGDCLNIMRPDTVYSNYWTVSSLKLLDNVICDTIRVKYNAVRLSDENVYNYLSPVDKDFFIKSSEMFHTYKMYHRSPTDGYFALRSSSGFYITCTKTRKDGSFDCSRISEVLEYQESSNTIKYRGGYLPSSDSVEAAIIFRELAELHSIIHTHDSTRFTRNPDVKDCSFVGKLPYGEAILGHEIVKKIRAENKTLVIMEEHGEIFIGSAGTTALSNLSKRVLE